VTTSTNPFVILPGHPCLQVGFADLTGALEARISLKCVSGLALMVSGHADLPVVISENLPYVTHKAEDINRV